MALLLTAAGCVNLPGAQPVDGLIRTPQQASNGAPLPASVTVPVTLDNNRMFVALTFRRRDGRARTALAWVNTGMGGLSLAPALRADLGGDGPVSFGIGDMPVTVEAAAVIPASAEDFAQQLGPMPVEATLPAGVLRQFRVTFDYRGRTLTLSRPSDGPAPGLGVPIKVNQGTGLVSVDARIDGIDYPLVIDSGAGYSWWDGDVVRELVARHPERLRAEGAVGRSNQAMVDQAFEQNGLVARIPVVALGPVQLREVGVLGSGPARGGMVGRFVGQLFWSAWGKGAPGPVVGWLGGNVLQGYRLTIDYRNRVTYWEPTAAPETDELNAVGVSLIHTPTGYRIGGLVSRGGATSAPGIEVGDEVAAIDGRAAATMTRGTILGALHGTPGDHRRLTLVRDGVTVEVDAVVGDYSGKITTSERSSLARSAND